MSPEPPISLTGMLELCVAGFALAGVIAVVAGRTRTPVQVTWGLFCASVFLMMIGKVFVGFGPLSPLVAVGGAATCGWFWLFSRSLFRSGTPFSTRHVLVVVAINGPALIDVALAGPAASMRLAYNGQNLLSSTILVLSFWEAVRTWGHETDPGERRLRLLFAALYGSAITLSVVWVSRPDAGSFAAALEDPVKALCALSAIVGGGMAVLYRLRHPIPALSGSSVLVPDEPSPKKPAPTEDDHRLAQRLEAQLRDAKAYLTPALKVSDLAARLGVADYRVSRAVTAVLGYANVNQLLNAYRIDHAKALLADPRHDDQAILSIALESGFGSVGPFNRAFKASVGMTPRAYRTAARNGDLSNRSPA